jgi:UDP:flavonoid glycosyltransferase YjiC (YdhE family)
MRFLLTSTGSHGDIHPFIAVGRALARRGHDVFVAVNPYYRTLVRAEGLRFVPFGEPFDLRALKDYGDVMHHRRGPRVVIESLMLPHLRAVAERLPRVVRRVRPDVVFHHHICLGVAQVCRAEGVRHASASLAPLMWLDPDDPFSVRPWWPLNPPPWLQRSGTKIARRAIRHIIDPLLRREMRTLGLLGPGQFGPLEIFAGAARGGHAALGLWSRHFRGPLPGDPDHGVITGFPWHDRDTSQEHDRAEVERFFEECERAGDAPILFSLGTAAVHVPGAFYANAAEVCRRLGRRGVLLVGRAERAGVPASLPAGVRVFTYLPFSWAMPRCAASVHHGGVGTTAQALRAGRPQVVVAHAHDQFDNAARVDRLGVGARTTARRASAAGLERALRRVLDDARVAQRAREVGALIAAEEDGAEAAARALEGVGRGAEINARGKRAEAGVGTETDAGEPRVV